MNESKIKLNLKVPDDICHECPFFNPFISSHVIEHDSLATSDVDIECGVFYINKPPGRCVRVVKKHLKSEKLFDYLDCLRELEKNEDDKSC